MAAELAVRVTLLDNLDEYAMVVPGTTRIADLKREVLARAGIKRSASEYLVKYKGAELYEGSRTLADAGVVPNGALIVLLRRRIPVK
jgi:hypothetical protein